MPRPPDRPRAIAFFDGQNLFNQAKEQWGYQYPNYDPPRLAADLCRRRAWHLRQVRFYTGIPAEPSDQRREFWFAKLASLRRRGVHTYSRPTSSGREKGIDLRLALDALMLALEDRLDVALIFSQDQDLTELVKDIRRISIRESRWIKVACAFPQGEGQRGINNTDWIPIPRSVYERSIDPRDYRGNPDRP